MQPRHRPPLLPYFIAVGAALLILSSLPVHGAMFLANTTIPIKQFSMLVTFCQAVNSKSVVVPLNDVVTKHDAIELMNSANVEKAYVSATYDVSATPQDYYWVITTDGVTIKTRVSASDFVNGVAPVNHLFFVLYSADPSAPGLIPYPGGGWAYPVLCATDDPTFTTLPPTTTTRVETTTTTTAVPPDKKGSGFPWWAILILVLGIVLILVVVLIAICCCFFECVFEDDLTEEAERAGSSSDSLSFGSHENRSFDHCSTDGQSKSTSTRHAGAADSCIRTRGTVPTPVIPDVDYASENSDSDFSSSCSSSDSN